MNKVKVTCAIAGIAIMLLYIRRLRKRNCFEPGPTTTEVYGNMCTILASNSVLPILEEWARSYGSIYTYYLFGSRRVVISHPALINQILADRPGIYRRAESAIQGLTSFNIDGLFGSESARWVVTRGAIVTFYNNIGTANTYALQNAFSLKARFAELAELGEVKTDVVLTFVQGAILNLCLQLTTSLNFCPTQSDLCRVYSRIDLRSKSLVSYWKYFTTAEDKAVQLILEDWRQSISAIIDHNIALGTSDSNNLLDYLLKSRIQEELTHPQIISIVIDVIIQSYSIYNSLGPITNIIMWLIHYLALHPEMQREVHKEIEAIDIIPSTDLCAIYVYTTRFVNEVLRLQPMEASHGVINQMDVQIQECFIPKGSEIVLLTRFASLQYTDRSGEFIPNRWLEEVDNDFAFGGGTRACPAEEISISAIVLFFVVAIAPFVITSNNDAASKNLVTSLKFTSRE